MHVLRRLQSHQAVSDIPALRAAALPGKLTAQPELVRPGLGSAQASLPVWLLYTYDEQW